VQRVVQSWVTDAELHSQAACLVLDEFADVSEEEPDRRKDLAPILETVRIEEEAQATPAEDFVTDDPLFGMWRDREDMADVEGYVRSIRASRFNDDGTRRKQ